VKLGSSIEIAEGVHQIWAVGARVTVLTEGDDVVLVDTGSRGSLGPITTGLESLGISPERVGLIVLTHYHPDHSGGLSGLVPVTYAKVAAHRSEADVLSGIASAPSPFRNGLVGKLAGPVINRFYGEAVEIDLLLDDGDRLPGSIDIDVIHTPGHTPGSICLYLPKLRLLMVGDALQYRFHRLSPAARASSQDRPQAIESLKKLLEFEVETMCFGHFDPLRGDVAGSIRKVIAKH
jgi:glyoxylase-like metal-dependent hydrolase (beta-lactamase superfamily II)